MGGEINGVRPLCAAHCVMSQEGGLTPFISGPDFREYSPTSVRHRRNIVRAAASGRSMAGLVVLLVALGEGLMNKNESRRARLSLRIALCLAVLALSLGG